MKNYLGVLLIVLVYTIHSSAQQKVFYIGHSLVNFEMPRMVQRLSENASAAMIYNLQITNGASIRANFLNPGSAQGDRYDNFLNNGSFNKLIVTEAVPLTNHITWSECHLYADKFYVYASNYKPDITMYIYETWHCLYTGTADGCPYDPDDADLWRARLTRDLPKWEGIMNAVNGKHSLKNVKLIPAGQAMAALYDKIMEGKVPGITSINQIFADDIHPNDVGNYFVACVMYSVIHGKSPVGLTNQLYGQYNNAYKAPTVAQAKIFQETAWETICKYPFDGVECTPIITANDEAENSTITIYPNPVNHEFHIKGLENKENLFLMDITGRKVFEKKLSGQATESINAENFPSGIYSLILQEGKKLSITKISIME